ncbi:MAG: polysaccharide deacetylase family protein [Calditrichaeota bacterium]|nr:MAG: polysaccharide deacetylase family protein [Calditrichota bacterium]
MKDNSIKVPILTYHHVIDPKHPADAEIGHSPFTVTKIQFHKQMSYLAQNGYRVLSLAQLLSLHYKKLTQNNNFNKSVVITFDDGWENNFRNAFPILRLFGFTATFFVISGKINTKYFMNWEQLLEMHKNNMHIESHTHTHNPLELLSSAELEWEFIHSKEILEKHLGKAIQYISYPHGSYNDHTITAAIKTHYRACTTSDFGYVTIKSNPYKLPRVMLRRTHKLTKFAKICERDILIFLKEKFVYNFKKMIKRYIGIERYNQLYKIRYRLTDSTNG